MQGSETPRTFPVIVIKQSILYSRVVPSRTEPSCTCIVCVHPRPPPLRARVWGKSRSRVSNFKFSRAASKVRYWIMRRAYCGSRRGSKTFRGRVLKRPRPPGYGRVCRHFEIDTGEKTQARRRISLVLFTNQQNKKRVHLNMYRVFIYVQLLKITQTIHYKFHILI